MNDTGALPLTFLMTTYEEDVTIRFSRLGMSAQAIARLLEMQPERAAAFVAASTVPGSNVSALMSAGYSSGVISPKLVDQVDRGDVEAIKIAREERARNRYNELLTYLDDDEFP